MPDGSNMETLTRTIWPTGNGNGNGNDSKYIVNRELSFTLADDIYIRYLSFNGADDLEAEMIKRFHSPTLSNPPCNL